MLSWRWLALGSVVLAFLVASGCTNGGGSAAGNDGMETELLSSRVDGSSWPCPELHSDVTQNRLTSELNVHELEVAGRTNRPGLTEEWAETWEIGLAIRAASLGEDEVTFPAPEAVELFVEHVAPLRRGSILTTDGSDQAFIVESSVADDLAPLLSRGDSVSVLVGSAPTPRHNVVDFLAVEAEGGVDLLGLCGDSWATTLGARGDGEASLDSIARALVSLD